MSDNNELVEAVKGAMPQTCNRGEPNEGYLLSAREWNRIIKALPKVPMSECIFCKGMIKVLASDYLKWQAACPGCGVQGPRRKTEDEARDAYFKMIGASE